MPEALPELVVFDLAGTTIEATDHIPRAFRLALGQYDVHVSDDEITAIRGRSKHEVIPRLLASHMQSPPRRETVEEVFRVFRDCLLDAYTEEGVTEIAGATETIDWLRSRDVRVALTTGFDRELASLLVRRAGWSRNVDALVAGDEVEHGRPAPDLVFKAMNRTGIRSAATVAVVGDTVFDLEAAHVQ